MVWLARDIVPPHKPALILFPLCFLLWTRGAMASGMSVDVFAKGDTFLQLVPEENILGELKVSWLLMSL